MADQLPAKFITLGAADFVEAFPFAFVMDAQDRVTLAGRGLARRLGYEPPCPIENVFEPMFIRGELSVADALRARKSRLKLKVAGTGIVLRGEAVPMAGGVDLLFVGSPQVSTLDQLAQCELKLSDFSVSDATPDLLMSAQATRTALDDARELSVRLRESVRQAEEAARAKGQFLAVMSHEIRTPMNGLGSMVDLLSQTPLNPEQLELIRTIDDCADSLQVLLDDVLDLSKLDAEGLETEMLPVCLSNVVATVLKVFRGRAEQECVDLAMDFSLEAPEWILGDPTRIRQVISNLVSNAIKFSARGKVLVRIAMAEEDRLSIRVEDTGIGIPTEAQATIFDPFTQADASTTRQFGGTGLGLSIARGLARAMGGDLELSCTSPSGTTFDFILPAITASSDLDSLRQTASLSSPELEACESCKGLSILVVDDNPVNLVIARRLIEKLEAKVTTVESGQAALDALAESSFDLVLLDLMMPRMSGVETARIIRTLPGPMREVPIVAFSADILPATRSDVLAAGMQGFLEKPVRLAPMREMLASFAPSRG